ncbi:MAG: acetoacetate--CoA ligase [Saprospiraceae bacterium]
MKHDLQPVPYWTPSEAFLTGAPINDYLTWLKQHRDLEFEDYEALWRWSVRDIEAFWGSLWEYFGILADGQYEAVLASRTMPGTKWFPGTSLNYAEHVFRAASPQRPALLFRSERSGEIRVFSWEELRQKTAAFAAWLKQQGVGPGDRVGGYLPAIPEATIAFLACSSIGAVWSCCSPDFGANSVMDRFQQIAPRILIAVDGYTYGGKPFHRLDVVQELCASLSSLEHLVLVPNLDKQAAVVTGIPQVLWEKASSDPLAVLNFQRLPFDHPLLVLYSSGTTGPPKAMVHGQGGILLEHLKYLAFHNNVRAGERFFWYSTTGWMMWNFAQSSLLLGATLVLYDGSPSWPDLSVLWELADSAGIHHFGTSASFLVAGMKMGLEPCKRFDLSSIRSVGSTGSPLPPEAFDYVQKAIGREVWLCSMSGGTDVCTAFVGGCPLLPVYRGEIQCRALGCALDAFDEHGNPLEDEVGEMVVLQPMPSMPTGFWNDSDGSRYRESYFDMYPGVWRHGDWVRITPRGTLVIYGRSDATLNRQGVRIGTAEIYRTLDRIPDISDSLVVNLELPKGRFFMPLFIVLCPGVSLDERLRQTIVRALRTEHSPRHVPDAIVAVPELPYTISGKKMEMPVKKILMGKAPERAANIDSMRNPDSLYFFVDYRKSMQANGAL